jgi:monoamine oxidase
VGGDDGVALQRYMASILPPAGRVATSPPDGPGHLDEYVGGGCIALPHRGTAQGTLPVPFAPVGGIRWAGAETASYHPGYLDGAIASGMRAANEIIEALAH